MFGEVAEWLKTTVIGVIVLGTCGSLLALLLLKLAKKLWGLIVFIFHKALPEQAKHLAEWYAKMKGKVMYAYGYRLGRFSSWNPSWGLAFYFAYHLLCTLCFLIISGVLLVIVFIILCGTTSEPILTKSTFLLIVLAFLSAFWAIRHFLFVFLPYRNFPLVQTLTKKFFEKTDQETRTQGQEGEQGSDNLPQQSDSGNSANAAKGPSGTPDP